MFFFDTIWVSIMRISHVLIFMTLVSSLHDGLFSKERLQSKHYDNL